MSIFLHKPTGTKDRLIEQGLIDHVALDAALTEQKLTGESLGSILIRNGMVTRHELLSAMHDTGDPNLFSQPFESDRIPHEVLLSLNAMLLGVINNEVLIATSSPKWLVQKKIEPYFANFKFRWMRYDPEILEEHMGVLRSYTVEEGIDQILRDAIIQGASDIHLIPKTHTYTLMYRLIGVRRVIKEISIDEAVRIIAQTKDRSRLDTSERSIPQDGSFSKRLIDRTVDFRVSTMPEINGERIILRVLDPEVAFPDLRSLGMTEYKKWVDSTKNGRGLCLICGPTGSGKSTTMKATIREMDRFGRNIVSVEEPVEYRMSYIGQVNVNRMKNLDFARALKGFMRQDPDVIIVGEIRDKETAEIAIQAAETGHMVIGTLHADTAKGGIHRLVDLGVPFNSFSNLLRASMAQKLIRTTCSICQGAGCYYCEDSGYAGRTLVSEVLTFDTPEEVKTAYESDELMTENEMYKDAVTKRIWGFTDKNEVERLFGKVNSFDTKTLDAFSDFFDTPTTDSTSVDGSVDGGEKSLSLKKGG